MTLVTTAADTKREKCALIAAEQIKQKLCFITVKVLHYAALYFFYDFWSDGSHGSFRHQPHQYVSSHNAAFQSVCHLARVPQQNNYTL